MGPQLGIRRWVRDHRRSVRRIGHPGGIVGRLGDAGEILAWRIPHRSLGPGRGCFRDFLERPAPGRGPSGRPLEGGGPDGVLGGLGDGERRAVSARAAGPPSCPLAAHSTADPLPGGDGGRARFRGVPDAAASASRLPVVDQRPRGSPTGAARRSARGSSPGAGGAATPSGLRAEAASAAAPPPASLSRARSAAPVPLPPLPSSALVTRDESV